MNRRSFLKASVPIATSPLWISHLGLAEQLSLPPAGADGWISLLNGRDLTGWYTMLQKSGKDVAQTRKIVVMEQEMLSYPGQRAHRRTSGARLYRDEPGV